MAYFGFTNKLIEGKTIEIFNFGNCKRDFTYVDDIVTGVKHVMQNAPEKVTGEDGLPIPPYRVYNIGNNSPENLLDFVSILEEELLRAGVLPSDYDFEAHKKLVPMLSLDAGNTPFLNEIEKEAKKTNVPIIRTEMQSFMKLLLAMHKPMSILEVGCAIGFSALLMSEYAPAGCKITTIEKYEKRIPIARENFKRAGKEDSITLLEGDAMDWLKKLEGPYDFIFMDAAKGQYIHFLPDILRLLKPDGILLSDNVLQGGDIIQSRYAVTRRNRTIHTRMRDYLYELKHHPQLETAILPVGDGITLSVRKA